MKKSIGILGGMGPLATADLFRKIVLLTDAARDNDHIRVYIDDNASIPDRGVSCKTIFDCTVPFAQKARFARAKFLDVDPRRWLPDWKPV